MRQVLRFAVIVAALVPAAAYGAYALYISPANGLEPTLLSELNLVRAENGLKPLRLNARLSAAANQHSMEMVEAGYFGHESADGSVFWRRIKRFYSPGRSARPWLVGENLLWQAPSVSAHAAVQEWLAEPRAPREPSPAGVPRRRHRRHPREGRAGRLPAPPRPRAHGRLRLSLAPGSACESAPDATLPLHGRL